MERDTSPVQPEKRKRRRRAPSHVPLHIQADIAERQQREHHEESSETKNHRKRKKKPESSPEIAIKEHKDSKEHVVTEKKTGETAEHKEPEESKTDEAVTKQNEHHKETTEEADHAETDSTVTVNDAELAEIPLDAKEVEKEARSPRLQRQNQAAETVPDAATDEKQPEDDEASSGATATVTTPRQSHPVATPLPAATIPNPNTPPPNIASPNILPLTPNVPPVPPNVPGNLPPVPPYNPNVYQGGGGNILPPTPIVAAANMAPNMQLSPNALNQFQERRHNGRAILAGILVGGLIEHIRHKRRAKRVEKAHTKEVKALNKDHEATRFQLKQSEIKGEETARKKTALERQLERLQKAPAPIERAANATVEVAAKPAKNEIVKPQAIAIERPRVEKVEKELTEAEKAIKKAQEAVQRAHGNLEEQPEVPSDRKVEVSSWHRIEVDKKTGNAVENPTIAYGEEFQHEQHQERLRKAADEASMGSDEIRDTYSPFKTLPTPGSTPNKAQKTLPQGPRSAKDQAIQKARDLAQGVNASPMDIGLWIVLLIVIWLIIAAL